MTDREKRRWDGALAGDDPFGPAMHAATPWRAAEARLLAKRVQELHEQGGWEWRDIVMLFRATTHMGFYERALEERGIQTHVVGGRGYWAHQQVADLRHWLAALANPLDELAVYSVLASPLTGLSLDAVALIGMESRQSGRDPWWLLRTLRRAGRPAAGGRPPPRRGLRGAVRGRAADGLTGLARDADRPRRHPHRLRPPHPRARGRPPAHGQRAQADAHGARVRGRRGPRPARLHRHARRAATRPSRARARHRSRPRRSTPSG